MDQSLAMADADVLGIPADFLDCAHPGPAWQTEMDAHASLERQSAALRALAHLSRDDLRSLLERI